MKKEKNIKIIENYEKLYEDLKIRFQNKEKENNQLKLLLKMRDKEIINLKKRLKYEDENFNHINSNNNLNEISQKYIQDLIKVEIENIKKEKIMFWNKILTSENYELQYLAPKLTTGNNHNYNFSSNKLINKPINNDLDKLYYNMKYEKKRKNKANSNKKRIIKKNHLNTSQEYKYRSLEPFSDEIKNNLNGSFHKILAKSKQAFNI